MRNLPPDPQATDGLSQTHKPARSLAARLAQFLFYQLLALALFVGFPALVTAIAPVSWVKFERRDGQVSATARVCLLFVLPYKTMRVSPVLGIGDRFVGGTVTRTNRVGRDRATKSEDEGFLVIHGDGQVAEVPVTPFNLKSVVQRSTDFLEDQQATELKLFLVANWKFSVVMGGLISLLTLLYVSALVFGGIAKVGQILRIAVAGTGEAPPSAGRP
jgi:hypothetical protein